MRKMHARALAESATMTIKVRGCDSHSLDDKKELSSGERGVRKKKHGAGDVYSVIDDGTIADLSHQGGFSLYVTPVLLVIREERRR